MDELDKELTQEDICTHLGDDYDDFMGAIVPPIFQNSLFTRKRTDHGYNYTRVSNPTIEIAEKKIAALEGGQEARCFSSGMAAISAIIMSYIGQGSHIIAPKNIYGPTRYFIETYLNRFGVTTTFVSGEEVEDFERVIRPETSLIYLESPVSNVFDMQDLEGIAKLARAKGIATVVDNTWATPIFQNPLSLGIDVVVHSATKYMGGHSDIVAGVMVGKKELMESITHNERGLFGATMDPHQAWLLIRGLRTLPLRMKQHQASALEIARFLEAHDRVDRVLYPGLESHPQYELGKKQMKGYSGLMGFVPKGNGGDIVRFVKALKCFEEGPSWGGFESLINTPGLGIDEETSKEMGIPQGLVRISIGLENVDTLMEDLDRALNLI